MTQPITPTQADREAAASAYFAWIAGNPVVPEKMRSGRVDDHSMVQAFARHAAAAREEALEQAARVAGQHCQARREAANNAKERKQRQEARDHESMAIEAAHIATAIRSLTIAGGQG